MFRRRLLTFVAVLGLMLSTAASAAAASRFERGQSGNPSVVVFNNIPETLPPSTPSLGYQSNSVSEFGDTFSLDGPQRVLDTVTVTMNDWAVHSDYPNMDAAGWTHPITLNIYEVNSENPTVPGDLIATKTMDAMIPWRPEPAPEGECDNLYPGYTPPWKAEDGSCNYGFNFNLTFDLSDQQIVLPDQVVVTVAYNTQTHGADPIGQPGPYNSLNVTVEQDTPSVGTDVNSDTAMLNSTWPAMYGGGEGQTGVLRATSTAPSAFCGGYCSLPVTIEAHLAGPPTSGAQCARGGWQGFVDPSFSSQTECVRYVAQSALEQFFESLCERLGNPPFCGRLPFIDQQR